MNLNIGCGRDIKSGWTNVDSRPLPGVDHVMNLEWDDFPKEWRGKIRRIYASHLIEHIDDILPLMENLWTVAAPDCELIVKCPHAGSDDAWGDPTHVRAIVEETFWAWGQPYYWRSDYGYSGDWRLEHIKYTVNRRYAGLPPWDILERIRIERNAVMEIKAGLVAVKPARSAGETPPIMSCRREVEVAK